MNLNKPAPPIAWISVVFASTTVALFLSIATLTNPTLPQFGQINKPSQSQAATTITVSVDPNQTIAQFKPGMRGIDFVNWEHSWGSKPFVNEVPGLVQAIKEINPGLLRYAGGLWANSVGFERSAQKRPYTEWTHNGMTYYFHYGTDELDSLAKFAKAVNADTMIQVNVSNNDPSMWADMVKYTNSEKGYGFKYWELGNELDLNEDTNISPTVYAQRFAAYYKAMIAMDSSIKLRGPAVAFAIQQDDSNSIISPNLSSLPKLIKDNGGQMEGMTWHWYQGCNLGSYTDPLLWTWDSTVPDNSWRNAYVRKWSTLMPSRLDREVLTPAGGMNQGVTELNVDACNYDNPMNGNHIGALWLADVLGRLAANGTDFVTMYDAYGVQAYSLLYPDAGDFPSRIDARPTYYTYIMYARYFGDQMVRTTTSNESTLSVWASKKTSEPNKLYVMGVNLSGDTVTSPMTFTTSVSNGKSYTMKSNNPTNISDASMTTGATTTINGIKIDAMDVTNSLAKIQPTSVSATGTSISYSFPAYSVTSLVFDIGGSSTNPTPTPTTNPSQTADINQDGVVNVFDLGILAARYGMTITASSTALDRRCDMNQDNTINVFDLGILVGQYRS